MPRLSRADSSLVVEILEQTLATSSRDPGRARRVEAVLDRLRGRIAQAAVASGESAQRKDDAHRGVPRVTASTFDGPGADGGALS